MIIKAQNEKTAPPSSSGPSGSLLEGAVAGFYLVTLLAKGEPRGLVGATITSVALQQAAFGFPMDDVVVHAINNDGSPATLEIQVKRSMTFTASDGEFSDVVQRMWQVSTKEEFANSRYELAIAIGKTTTRIEADCQEVLKWVKEALNAAEFAAHIERKGFASEGMRSFVDVFRANLRKAGAPDDGEAVWSLLRRFQILVFDFESPGSDYDHRTRERCRGVLQPHEGSKSGELWTVLTSKAMRSATAAGGFDYATLTERLNKEHGFALAVPPDLRFAHMRLQEQAKDALRDIKTKVGGVHLSRVAVQDAAKDAVETNRIAALVGAPGSGKSAILKHLAELRGAEGTVVVLSRGRIIAGGWTAWASDLKFNLSQADFFNELSCGGGALLCIDNIDQIDDSTQVATVSDLLHGVLASRGWQVIFTAIAVRPELQQRFPELGNHTVAQIDVPELSDEEGTELSQANGALAALLSSGHPAQRLARNLFHLSRLLALSKATDVTAGSIATETTLASVWWKYGGGRSEADKLERLKLLRTMGKHVVAAPAEVAVRTDDLDASTVQALIGLDVLREHQPGFSVTFRHDVLRDWSVGFLLREDPAQFANLNLKAPIPESLARPLEFTARLALDADASGKEWLGLLEKVSHVGAHGSWRRPVLLALTRSEHAYELLQTLKPVILDRNGELFSQLIRMMLSVETRPLTEVLACVQPSLSVPRGLESFVVPNSQGWIWLITWITANAEELPYAVIPDVARLYQNWLLAGSAQYPGLSSAILKVVFDWLVRTDRALRPRVFTQREDIEDPDFSFANMEAVREDLQFVFLNYCQFAPALAEQYLKSLGEGSLRYQDVQSLLQSPGSLARAAPAAYVQFVLSQLTEDDEDEPQRRRDLGPFSGHDFEFRSATPGQGAFFELLQQAPADGLRLVRGIVEYATEWRCSRYRRDEPNPGIKIPFPDGDRSFSGDGSVYGWVRSEAPSPLTTTALMALEAWGHLQIEAGRAFEDVLRDILGEDGSSMAFLAVAVDLALSHWDEAKSAAWPLLASPELLRLDQWRYEHDVGQSFDMNPFRRPDGAHAPIKRADLEARPSRQTRLWDRFGELLEEEDVDIRRAVRDALAAAKERLVATAVEDKDPVNGLNVSARRAWRMTDPTNWEDVVIERSDGSIVSLRKFKLEDNEAEILKARQKEAQADLADWSMRASIEKALLNAASTQPTELERFLQWAKAKQRFLDGSAAPAVEEEVFEFECNKRAIVMAAALAVRDVVEKDRAETLAWALPVLHAAVQSNASHPFESPHLRYNEKALGYLGLLLAYERGQDGTVRDQLLELATDSSAAMRSAFGERITALLTRSPELVRASLRVGIVSACLVRSYDEEQKDAERTSLHAEIANAIESEKRWLSGKADEPGWPTLPAWKTRPRRGFRIGGMAVEETREEMESPGRIVNEHALGHLIGRLIPLTTKAIPAWLPTLAERLLVWTLDANGPPEEDADGRPYEWNGAFFDFLGVLSVALPHAKVIVSFVVPMTKMGDDAFCDSMAAFIRGFDRATFASDTAKSDDPVAIRSALAERLESTRCFRRSMREKSATMERHVGDAVSALFFHKASLALARMPTLPQNWQGLAVVMPPLTRVVKAAPTSQYIAAAFLNLIQDRPMPDLLPGVAEAVSAWGGAYEADPAFWVESNIGSRLCRWLDELLLSGAITEVHLEHVRSSLHEGLDRMVRAGLAQARITEEKLNKT